ncbi:DUF1064 domain-containing protein [Pseudomonas massiliensis]|uniref:DUF1064 domain-containing protein n=1 Tax=Pseudomonas massiliensis TaxID=522492 RepID=UPI0005904499|nr:DUF1064 domain-containing protein [Pseudomonas massiliensis]
MTMLTLPWPPAACSPKGKWSLEEDAALRVWLEAGASQAEIAVASGRTAGSVKNRAWRLGLLESRAWTPEQEQLLRQAWAAGSIVDVAAVSAAIGKSKFAVYIRASRLGLGDYSRPIVEERKVRTKMFEDAEERRAHLSAVRKRLVAERGHPRHMAGKKHTDATKALLSQASIRANAAKTPEQKMAAVMKAAKTRVANGTHIRPRPNASWKAGWREIGGVRKYYRSKWEANYAHYLEWLKQQGQIASWAHEPKTFWFEGVKRGCVSYLPDFLVIENDGREAFHEVKGWMDARSATKIKRMAKYHPDVTLIVIDSSAYGKLKTKVSRIVPGWEA